MDVGSCPTNPRVSTRSAKAKAFHEPEERPPRKSCYYYFPNSRPPSPAGGLAAPMFQRTPAMTSSSGRVEMQDSVLGVDLCLARLLSKKHSL